MTISIKTGQVGIAAVRFTDDSGVAQPVPSGSMPAWSVAPASALVLTPLPSGYECEIKGGLPSDFTLTARLGAIGASENGTVLAGDGTGTPGINTKGTLYVGVGSGKIDNSLPAQPGVPGHDLPKPGKPAHPDHDLPNKPGRADNELPEHAAPKR
jgi:hypothetical protein